MKTKFTTSSVKAFALMLTCFFITNTTFAQFPVNDNVCNAMPVALGGTGAFMVVDTATVETGEQAISPPLGNCVHGWCDALGIESSVWFTFTAPASGSVNVSLCGSNYDTQLAVYEVGTCSDFSTFTYIFGNDDSPFGTVGATCGPSPGANTYGNSSELDVHCLTPGQIYYVVVDTWLGNNAPQPSGQLLDIKINSLSTGATAPVLPTLLTQDPICPAGMDGAAQVDYEGIEAVNFLWSNGQTGVLTTGLAQGTYMVTMVNSCGATAVGSVMINDGLPSTVDTVTVIPAFCGTDGSAIVSVDGVGPYSFLWSNGSTLAQPELAAGVYTVSITDACSAAAGSPMIETISIPGGTNLSMGNFTITQASGCTVPFTGIVNNVAPNKDNSVTHSTDQTLTGSVVACFDGSTGTNTLYTFDNYYWRGYDLATDFSITTDYHLGEIEIGVRNASSDSGEQQQPFTVTVYTVDNTDLSSPNANITLLKSIKSQVPDTTNAFVYVPLDVMIPAGQKFAIRVGFEDGFPAGRSLFFGQNDTPTLGNNETFLTSARCGLSAPTPMSGIGFPNQVVFNLVEYTYDVTWTPATYLDDATALAPVLTAPQANAMMLNYTVTVVDGCGAPQTTTVTVDATDCFLSNVEGLVDASFTISPNPSNGLFNIQNQGSAREMTLEVFDLSGKNLVSTVIALGQGDVTALDLSAVASGMYIAKLTDGDQAEIHKLIVE